MFKYTLSTFSPPIIFLGYFLIQISLNFLCSSYQKKVCAIGSFPPQNQSKLANQTSLNHCERLAWQIVAGLTKWGHPRIMCNIKLQHFVLEPLLGDFITKLYNMTWEAESKKIRSPRPKESLCQPVTCHMSHDTCDMPLKKIYWQSGGASWLSVCYQRGLPRLVFYKETLVSLLILLFLSDFLLSFARQFFPRN